MSRFQISTFNDSSLLNLESLIFLSLLLGLRSVRFFEFQQVAFEINFSSYLKLVAITLHALTSLKTKLNLFYFSKQDMQVI